MNLLYRCRAALWLACLLFALPVWGRPLPPSRRPVPRDQVLVPLAPAVRTARADADTVVLLGGPGRLDGRFEDAQGAPAWHGWSPTDNTASTDTFWTISTFNAEALGGHGPGNHAMWCGTEFPGGDAGYGNDWQQHLGWRRVVADVLAPVTVQVLARLSHDTEPGFDRLHLQVWRGDTWQTQAYWEGWHIDRAVDETFMVEPGQFGGPDSDEVLLRFSFYSDEAWSDEDGLYPTDGACQLDDVTVLLDGAESTFDDFEPGSDVHWEPRDFLGAGAFAQLLDGLNDLDPCRDDLSTVVAFVDDGLVVPGTGGSPCITWCYGPDGMVVNSTGGLLGPEHGIAAGVMSPALAWPDGHDDLLLEFDAYVHEPLAAASPGIVYRWRVRSTASDDPAGLTGATWLARTAVYHGGPQWRRHGESCGDLLVADRRWVQVELEVLDYGPLWGLDGDDASPAPYFDNVALKATVAAGPRIVVEDQHLPQDTFPASGHLAPDDPARSSCRFDMARNISPPSHLRIDPGDSVVAEVRLLRPGAALDERPRLVALLKANPLFDAARLEPPGPDGLVLLEAVGDTCRDAMGEALSGRWAFDLPDTGLFFPGDVIHFYVEAHETAVGGDVVATWPADTTGFADFTTATRWPAAALVRALPSVRSAEPGDQPALLFWQDYSLRTDGRDLWEHALTTLGLQLGLDYDLYRTRDPSLGVDNGLGARATAEQLDGYGTLLYDSGDLATGTLTSGDHGLLLDWLTTSQRQAFFAGDGLAGDLATGGSDGATFLNGVLGVEWREADLAPAIGGQTAPLVATLSGNTVFTSLSRWRLHGGCPQRRTFDAVTAVAGVEVLAEFTGPDGAGGLFPYAAACRHVGTDPVCDVISVPHSLFAVRDPAGGSGQPEALAARVRLLADVLTIFGQPLPVPVAAPAADPAMTLSISSQPNPFNPRTTVTFSLPAAGHATVTVVDLRGRLVRTLVDGVLPAGPGRVTWDGADRHGRSCASGIYFHVLRSAGHTSLGKMTLVR